MSKDTLDQWVLRESLTLQTIVDSARLPPRSTLLYSINHEPRSLDTNDTLSTSFTLTTPWKSYYFTHSFTLKHREISNNLFMFGMLFRFCTENNVLTGPPLYFVINTSMVPECLKNNGIHVDEFVNKNPAGVRFINCLEKFFQDNVQ